MTRATTRPSTERAPETVVVALSRTAAKPALAAAWSALAIAIGAAVASERSSLAVAVTTSLFAVSLLMVRPQLPLNAFMLVLGAAPFAAVQFRGLNVPLICILAATSIVAAVRSGMRSREPSHSNRRLEVWLILYIVGCTASFVLTRGAYLADDNEYFKWLPVAVLPAALSRFSDKEVARSLAYFIVGVTAGCISSMAMYVAPSLLKHLGVLGYLRTTDDQRVFFVGEAARATRLGGMYVDPNIAGIFFLAALALLLALASPGPLRTIAALILVAGIGMTLSRGAILGLGVAGISFIVAKRHHVTQRVAALTILMLLSAAAIYTPTIGDRLSTSFSGADRGTTDRMAAIEEFPQDMSGSWGAGLGWGRPEYRESGASFATNMVANAPLAAVYRSGVLGGVPFVILMLALLIAALRMLRSLDLRAAIIAAGSIGVLAASQTGYATVIMPQAVALFSVILTAVVSSSRQIENNGTEIR